MTGKYLQHLNTDDTENNFYVENLLPSYHFSNKLYCLSKKSPNVKYEKNYSEYKLDWSEVEQAKEAFSKIIRPKIFKPSKEKLFSGKDQDMSISQVYELLKEEIHKENEMTRSVVREESSQLKKELVDFIKDNPIETVELFSKLTMTCALFALCVSWISGFDIINPWFASLLLASSFSGIIMVKIRKNSTSKRKNKC